MQDIFCERLKKSREIRGLTQNELGTKAQLPPSSIAHFETGTRKPSFDNLRRLAEALSVTTDYLLGRVDKPGLPASADVLFRDFDKLSDNDRDITAKFIQMLTERNSKNG
ncbi:MAG: helix-turn-helix transcriptional regulator [Termitinemataceae bacterium]|nr:MAG: helix-turn-helix transcriptional regulator [Termitinemataceae bacterium]